MDDLPELEDLIQLVEDMTPDGEPLRRLTDSMMVAGGLTDTADELIGHFVEQARDAGSTWAEIGDRMGVSKQAAQKRFVSRTPRPRRGFFLTRFADQARSVVRAATDHARSSGRDHVGTEHLVIGLLDDPACRAALAIAALGGDPDDLRTRAQAMDDRSGRAAPRHAGVFGGSTGSGHIPFSSHSKKVLELALREAIRTGNRRIETEHVLLGILRDETSPGARLLIADGITRKAVAAWLEDE